MARESMPAAVRWQSVSGPRACRVTAAIRAFPMVMAHDARLNVLLLFPGPVYHLPDYFQRRLEGLSTIASGTVLLNSEKSATAQFGEFEVLVTADDPSSRLRSWLRRFPDAIKLAEERKRSGRPFDLIVSYDPLKSGLLGWWIARRFGIPLIVEVNGDYTSRANYKDVPSRLGRALKRLAFMSVERFTLSRSRGIKLLYATQIDAFRRASRSAVVRTFPDFVDTTRFADRGEEHVILFVGFPFFLKGVDLLIDAFRQVSDEFPDWTLKLLGWFENLDEMKAYVAGHPRIAIHRPVRHQDMPDHIGRCGIFVLPSRSEAMGRVLVEAMASGKPCIGSDVGGIPTVIRHEDNGLLFPSGDVTALALALRTLMGDAELRRSMGHRGAEYAGTYFSPDAYFQHIASFYQDVVATHDS